MKYYLISNYLGAMGMQKFDTLEDVKEYLSECEPDSKGIQTYMVIVGHEYKVELYPGGTVQLRDES